LKKVFGLKYFITIWNSLFCLFIWLKWYWTCTFLFHVLLYPLFFISMLFNFGIFLFMNWIRYDLEVIILGFWSFHLSSLLDLTLCLLLFVNFDVSWLSWWIFLFHLINHLLKVIMDRFHGFLTFLCHRFLARLLLFLIWIVWLSLLLFNLLSNLFTLIKFVNHIFNSFELGHWFILG